MAENGYGPGPVSGHIGKIPNYGKTQVNPMGSVEPPACIQNAMMTKDKKPFTYTPGGLDLSQIRTPSMARRLARQRSLEEQEQAAYNVQHPANGNTYHPQGGPAPPPPPPPMAPAPPPPPPLIIEASTAKSPKPVPLGERPEIVIPENPIGMLRKTNSPYHWEAEKAETMRMGAVPKFVEKVPSPMTVKMPPSSFSQQPPQSYAPQGHNNVANNTYSNRTPESPVHKPEPIYAQPKSASPNACTPTRDFLQRQDSQFNKSPMPFGGQSPLSNNTAPFSPSPNSSWKQPDRREYPVNNTAPTSFQNNQNKFSPLPNQQYSPPYQTQTGNAQPNFHTLPRAGQRVQDNYTSNVGAQRDNNINNNAIYNNTHDVNKPQSPGNATPWRTNTLNRNQREVDPHTINHNQNNNHSWKSTPEPNNNQNEPPQPWKQTNQTQQYIPPWVTSQDPNNRSQESPWRNNQKTSTSMSPQANVTSDQPRYQSHISIPVTPKQPKQEPEYNQTSAPHKEAVYVTQEPVYYCADSPNSVPPWVKTQKEKTKTPPPLWCQRPLEGRKSAPRELVTPPRESNVEPDWVHKSNEMQRNIREVVSPPKYQQTAQPTWSTRPSENRKSLPRDNGPMSPSSRVIPVQMEISNGDQGRNGGQQPHLRIVIDTQNPNAQEQNWAQAPYSQPTQRIMRVLSPQLVRLDEGPQKNDFPTLSRSFQNDNNNLHQNQPKTRIIPIQLESGGNEGPNKSFGGRY